MPKAAPRLCTFPACRVLVHDGSGRCAAHPRLVWGKRAEILEDERPTRPLLLPEGADASSVITSHGELQSVVPYDTAPRSEY